MVVSHNTIGYAPHMATFGHGNDNIWEYNYFHDLCFETTDSGAFYAGRSWVDRGNIVQHSTFERIRRLEHNASLGWTDVNAIYLDDFMSGYYFNNITIKDTDMGIVVGGGRDNIIQNFTFINVDYPIHFDKRGMNWGHKGCKVPNGILPNELVQYPYKSGIWSRRYPELVHLLDDRPCTPVNNHISNIKFCHTWSNNTLWLQSGDTSVAELLLWDNTFDNIHQDMSYCDGGGDNNNRTRLR